MKKYLTLATLSLAASALLVGCGGNTVETAETQTGYFIDAPVAGLSYKTSSGFTGTTDSKGSFRYQEGEEVAFSIGKLTIGSAEPTQEGLVSPRELSDNEETVQLILRTLQALDIDNNTSNGITIPPSVITALEGITAEVNLVELTQESEVLDISVDLSEHIDEDYDGAIDVNTTEAVRHYQENLDHWENGERPDDGQIQGHNENGGGGQTSDEGNNDEHRGGNTFNLSDFPDSNLTQELIDSLAYMGNEERLAYDIYTVLYNYHSEAGTEIKQLANIPKSERKHVEIVQSIVQKYHIDTNNLTDVDTPVADKDISFDDMPTGTYDIQAIQALYDSLYDKGIASKQAALEVGCMVEVVDVNDLDRYIAQAEASNAADIVAGFNLLRNGSYNHYWAFDKGLKNMGVTEGCAVLGEEWAKTPEEYPSSANTNGNGNGNGNGNRNGNGNGNGYQGGRGR